MFRTAESYTFNNGYHLSKMNDAARKVHNHSTFIFVNVSYAHILYVHTIAVCIPVNGSFEDVAHLVSRISNRVDHIFLISELRHLPDDFIWAPFISIITAQDSLQVVMQSYDVRCECTLSAGCHDMGNVISQIVGDFGEECKVLTKA